MFFDHLDAGAAILGNLVDVCSFHQAEANVRVPKAVRRPAVALAIEFQIFFVQDVVKQLPVIGGEDAVGRLWLVPPAEAHERLNGARRTLAVPDAAFAAHFDLQDRFSGISILHDRHVSIL